MLFIALFLGKKAQLSQQLVFWFILLLQSTTCMKEQICIEPPLYFAEQNLHIWCAQFHPFQDIIATTLINGNIEILQYDSENVNCLVRVTDCHKSSARYCSFNPTGTLLATCSEDKRLGFIDSSGKIAHRIKKAHQNPINRVQFATQQILVSGDDQGVIKVWDLRQSQCVFEAHEQSQAITGFYYDESFSNVIASSLDGTVAVYDLKQGNDSPHKLYSISDSADEELHGIISMKDGKYLACPSSQNSVLIFKREDVSHFIDRIQGQPGSVEAIVKVDENTFITGCEDGYVRGMSLKPNKILKVIGQHEQDERYPIQSVSLSHCKRFLASTSHDNSIKFYDVSDFVRGRKSVNEEDHQQNGQLIAIQNEKQSEIFQDDSDDMEDESDSDEKVEEKKPAKKKKQKTNMKARETEIKKDSMKKFFQGL